MMEADRRNYVMSAEAAMAREMAYRNKLHTFFSIDSTTAAATTTTTHHPLHSQVAVESTYQRPGMGMPLGSIPPPHPHMGMGQTRIWNPTPSTDRISMSAPIWRPINPSDQKRKGPTNPERPANNLGTFWCLLCQIDCTTSHNLMMHYQGQRHMARLLGEPMSKKSAGGSALSTAKDRLYCKFCGIWCKDEFTFRLHLQCKNHVLTLQEHEKKMKKQRN